MNNTVAPSDQPMTNAKVILYTTNGELEIDVWGREMPIAARNFIQLCLEGYYDNTIFHRVIPGFMIQGGDPAGTGTGGESIYGSPFKDEFHQRLRFGRRGMVAMANSGKDTNGSQFFITFGECPHLNKKHTIFGKVIGDSVYTLLSFQSLDTDENDKPNDPPYIRRTKVVLNPFDDIVPRVKQKEQNLTKIQIKQQQAEKGKKLKSEIKKLKNKKKLTFEDEGQIEQTNYKIKSSHDTLNDQRLSKQAAITQEEIERRKKEKQEEEKKKKQVAQKVSEALNKEQEPEGLAERIQAQMLKKRKAAEAGGEGGEGQQKQDEILQYRKVLNRSTGKMEIVWGQQNDEENDEDSDQKMRRIKELQEQEYEGLKADELNFKRLREGSMKEKRKRLVEQEKTLLSNVEKRKYAFLKKSQVEKKETEMFDRLSRFTDRLQANKANDWMCHRLKFHIDSENAYNLDKKNQERKGRAEDLQDGGLKVQFSKIEEQNELDLDELYELAKGE